MFARLWKWVPVIFGLKIAGVSPAAASAEAPQAPPAAQTSRLSSGLAASTEGTKPRAAGAVADAEHAKIAEGSATQPSLTESFVFAKEAETSVPTAATAPRSIEASIPSDAGSASDIAQPRPVAFVPRPIALQAPRPLARLEQAAALHGAAPTLVRSPDQVRQVNRPSSRVAQTKDGKRQTRRVVWIADRVPSRRSAGAPHALATVHTLERTIRAPLALAA
ncbi:MAG: hypothetical protein AAFQ35_11055 [Pseudomonadota bacterium]